MPFSSPRFSIRKKATVAGLSRSDGSGSRRSPSARRARPVAASEREYARPQSAQSRPRTLAAFDERPTWEPSLMEAPSQLKHVFQGDAYKEALAIVDPVARAAPVVARILEVLRDDLGFSVRMPASTLRRGRRRRRDPKMLFPRRSTPSRSSE